MSRRTSENKIDREGKWDVVFSVFIFKEKLKESGIHMIIITNNPLVVKELSSKKVIYKENTYIEILKECRDLIHKGYELLSHPLYGSVKPNETPYRSIIIKEGKHLDTNSLSLIEEAINTASKFQNNKKTPRWTPQVLDDFQVIDLDILTNTIQRI
ncbi:MAG: GrdX family protein [Romboutsia sp.]